MEGLTLSPALFSWAHLEILPTYETIIHLLFIFLSLSFQIVNGDPIIGSALFSRPSSPSFLLLSNQRSQCHRSCGKVDTSYPRYVKIVVSDLSSLHFSSWLCRWQGEASTNSCKGVLGVSAQKCWCCIMPFALYVYNVYCTVYVHVHLHSHTTHLFLLSLLSLLSSAPSVRI